MCLRLIALLLFLSLAACQSGSSERTISGFAQGTTYHVTWVDGKSVASVETIQQKVDQLLAELDTQLSNYRDDSEISRLNRQETGDWLPVSSEIIGLLTVAQTIYQRSESCYDLTVKPLFDLWGFSKHENRIPSDQEIAALQAHIGMNLLEIDASQQRIRKKDPSLKIDLSSIAQGYSVGRVAKALESLGIHDYLVEIGGEMLTKGRKSSGKAWRIGVESPSATSRDLQKILTMHDATETAVMTAGTYRNFFEQQGKQYSHILNPKSGKPVDHHLYSVTIVHDDPTWADAWDTALLCMGEDRAKGLADRENLKVLLIYEQNGKLQEYSSKAFEDWQAKPE